MTDAYVIAVEGLSALRGLDAIPREIQTAALRAVNATADRAAVRSRRRVRDQVNFPARYLTGKDSSGRQRLGVSKRARGDDLEAIVTGRHRPTSLARFATGGRPGKNGVTVQVAPGFARFMRRAFLIRLPAGKAAVETKSNLGLAIRLKPGERIEHKRRMVQVRGNLYLLYGPSIDQVVADAFDEQQDDNADFLEREFVRLVELDI